MDPAARFFAEQARIQSELAAQFRAAPIVQIRGITSDSPPGAIWSQGMPRDQFTLLLPLAAYRINGGDIHSSELILRTSGSRTDCDTLQKLAPSWTVIEVDAHFVSDSVLKTPSALMLGMPVLATDADLSLAAGELQKPLIPKDEVFGRLKLDRSTSTFEGRALWLGRKIAIQISSSPPHTISNQLKIAHAAWKKQSDWNDQVLDFAVTELLNVKNEAWREEDEPEIYESGFRANLSLASIHISEDNSIIFSLDNKGMFMGHTIEVRATLTEGPTSADLVG